MLFCARRAGARLLLVTILATAFSAAANSTSASMQVSVTVVRSCSVQPDPTAVTIDCRKGAAEMVRFGVDADPSRLERITPGANRIPFDPAHHDASERLGPAIITIDF
jgi:hypothetical protein